MDKTKICNKCGEEKPLTKEYFSKRKDSKDGFRNYCKVCKNKHDKNYYINNKDKFTEYYKQNNIKKSEYDKKYYQNNKLKKSNYNNKYWENNKYKIIIYRNENIESRKETRKLYKKNNKQKINNYVHKRNANKKTLPCTFSEKQWEQTKNDFRNKCAYCGKEEKLTQDHFIPLSKRGEYTINNIIPACSYCNSSKGNTDFLEWYPKQKIYNKKQEQKILKYLNYNLKTKIQQLALI